MLQFSYASPKLVSDTPQRQRVWSLARVRLNRMHRIDGFTRSVHISAVDFSGGVWVVKYTVGGKSGQLSINPREVKSKL